jgi:hypothetical protein
MFSLGDRESLFNVPRIESKKSYKIRCEPIIILEKRRCFPMNSRFIVSMLAVGFNQI